MSNDVLTQLFPQDRHEPESAERSAEEKVLGSQLGDRYDQVISTNPSSIISRSHDLQSTDMTSSSITGVSVGVVNLFYSIPNLLPVSGFGYLIPQSIPFEQNPELALGVVFDSDAVQGQDTTQGTKLTVMLGGHWWDKFGRLPSVNECSELAASVVRRHLNITDKPAVLDVTVNNLAIPQYPVNYRRDYLRRDHEFLLNAFYGRMKVAGAYFNGVGVNDCVRSAMDIAESALSPDWRDKNGLEVISRPPEFAKLEPSRNREARMKR